MTAAVGPFLDRHPELARLSTTSPLVATAVRAIGAGHSVETVLAAAVVELHRQNAELVGERVAQLEHEPGPGMGRRR